MMNGFMNYFQAAEINNELKIYGQFWTAPTWEKFIHCSDDTFDNEETRADTGGGEVVLLNTDHGLTVVH